MSALSETNPVDAHLWACFLITVLTGTVIHGIGSLLVPKSALPTSWLHRSAAVFASGLIFIVGCLATWELGRVTYLTLIPLIQIGLGAWSYRKAGVPLSQPEAFPMSDKALLFGSVSAMIVLTWWMYPTANADGSLAYVNSDLGYFALMAKALPEAKVASIWAAAFGSATAESGESKDVWYHWGPIWLASGISRLSGLTTFTALLRVVIPLLNCLVVLSAASMVSLVTGWKFKKSLLAGFASILAVPLSITLVDKLLRSSMPQTVLQHAHSTLGYMVSYKLEAVLVMATISAWYQRRLLLAAALLFFAGISAPHTVAIGGIMAGVFGVIGLIRRDAKQYRLAAAIIGILIAAWSTLKFGFGTGLPQSESAKFIILEPAVLVANIGAAALNIVIGIAVSGLAVPGIVHLLRAKDEAATEETRLLGWLAVSALIGSYSAYHLLLPDGERFHFTMYAHAMLVMPIGFWGLVRMIQQEQSWSKYYGIAAMSLATCMGAYDQVDYRLEPVDVKCTLKDLAILRGELRGELFGYFSRKDRNWWITRHSVVGSMLDSRATRLNTLEIDDLSRAKFYGSARPLQLLPVKPGEDELDWCLRLADKLKLKFLIEFDADPLPAEFSAKFREAVKVPGMRLLAIH